MKKIYIVVLIAVLIIAGAYVVLTSSSGDDYWFTEWNTQNTDPDGRWAVDIQINYADGTSQSYRSLMNSKNNIFTVYHEGNIVSSCKLKLGMLVTGDYPECEIDLENFAVRSICRRHLDEDGSVIVPPETPVYDVTDTGLCLSSIIVPVGGTYPVWHPDFWVEIPLDSLHIEDHWLGGTYIVGYNISGSGKFRGIDNSVPASPVIGSWNSIYPPSEVGAVVVVDPYKVTIDFQTDIQFYD